MAEIESGAIMKVKFTDSGSGRLILKAETTSLPRRDEMVVINDVVYECRGIKHIFESEDPDYGYFYDVEVQIKPI
jgi:hypothetical protein